MPETGARSGPEFVLVEAAKLARLERAVCELHAALGACRTFDVVDEDGELVVEPN